MSFPLQAFVILQFILLTNLSAQIIFSEVMFDLPGADYHDEFIELYNLSSATTVDIEGWLIADSTHVDRIVAIGEGATLEPGQFAVILDGSYFDNSERYDDVIPAGARILKIDDNAFLRNGLTNSKPQNLKLLNRDSQVVQEYRYSIGNQPGYSDEKILLTPDNDSTNWANSNVLGGTPGSRNSVTPYEYDIGFGNNGLIVHPTFNLLSGRQVNVRVTIMNRGLNRFQANVLLHLFIDSNKDSLFDPNETLLLNESLVLQLEPSETYSLETNWTPDNAGKYWLVGTIEAPSDENSLNNTHVLELDIYESAEHLIINEIKFLSDDGEPEWIELFNSGEDALSLQQWAIADNRDTVRIDSSLIVNPGEFFVISADTGLMRRYSLSGDQLLTLSGMPTFNNTEDVVYLLNPAGHWIEQVPYSKDWLEGQAWRNPSLERIHQNSDSRLARNWGPSTSDYGATPGRENSINAEALPVETGIQIAPNPFSPDNDGHEDHAVIALKLPLETARIRVEIFNINGIKIRTIVDNHFSGSMQSVIWNGRDDRKKRVPAGIYIVYVQFLNDRRGVIRELKKTIVVARRL